MCTAKRKFNLNPVILLWVLEGLIEPSLQWNTKGLLNGFLNFEQRYEVCERLVTLEN